MRVENGCCGDDCKVMMIGPSFYISGMLLIIMMRNRV